MDLPDFSSLFPNILNIKNLIAGEFLDSGDDYHSVTDKYTGQEIAQIPMASSSQVETAIAAATAAADDFRKWSASKRRSHLEKVLALFRAHSEEFIQLIAAESGKPYGYAKGEVNRCQTTLQLAIDETTRFAGEVVNVDYDAGIGRTAYTKRIPIGPVACISPFNFPLNLALHKIAPALAVGCPVVLKPSPFSPLTAMAFAGLCQEAGYPPGFVNVFLANNEHAELIVTDPRMKLFSFTGSPKIGWMLKKKAGKKRVILELGGNAACIVEESADLEFAAERLAIGSYLYAGQICISTQRILVQESIAEDFKERLLSSIADLKVGDPRDKAVMVGPIIDRVHLERISEWVEEAKSAGATVLAGGEIIDEERNLYAPTLLTDVPQDLKIVREEAFGPVAIIESFKDFPDALTKVNDTRFGLQAGLFTNRLDFVQIAHDEIEVAGLIVNDVPGFRVDGMPYGGIKDSGLGREGVRYAMEDMTEPRLLVLNRPKSIPS